MDTSKTYIKMCEGLPDYVIEDLRLIGLAPTFGDTWYVNGCLLDNQGNYWFDTIIEEKDGRRIVQTKTPLPLQDQLQEMLEKSWIEAFNDFVWWVQTYYGSGVDEFVFEDCKDFTSMEQLWLAFVMSEEYHKIWNGEEWKEIK